ncbi:MAG: SusD/RagB family nutrient-binding outer membrane lipoprotein [Saprospiraceae bacterium]
MKKFLYMLSILSVLLIVTSCSESLTDVNIDPNNPTQVSLNLQLPEILAQSAFNEGTNPNRVAGIVTQQFFGLDAQQLAYNNYLLGADVMNNYWGTGLYAGVLRSCSVIINGSEDRPIYGAIAKIVMANEFGKATSFFGDIPYSEAFQGTDNLTPKYDSQESVYGSVQTLLSEAISELEGGAGGYFGGDLVYDGDAASWIKTAHGLKARYYMHTSKRNGGDAAKAMAEVGMSFASNAEAGGFQFEVSESANWSLAKFGIERPSTLGVDDRFAAMMENDPRLPAYSEFDGTQWTFFNGAQGTLVWGRSDAKVPTISFVELKFIQAEAMASGGGNPSAVLEEAILASMELSGVVDDGYAATASSDASVENIVTEAYKAYFGFNFHESWTNWRRTGFPALVASSGCGDNGFNPSCSVPQRYLYAESERQTNRENVEAATAAQGGDLLDVALWAFK